MAINERVIKGIFFRVEPATFRRPAHIVLQVKRIERPHLSAEYEVIRDATPGDLAELTARGFINPLAGAPK